LGAGQPLQAVAQDADSWDVDSSASSMIRRMVRAQRPHWALQPRQPYTWLVERGFASA